MSPAVNARGYLQAKMALSLLSGKPIERIYPLLMSPNEYIFDDRELRRLKITLPQEVASSATILHPKQSFYEANREFVIASIVVLGAALFLVLTLSVVLLTLRKRQLLSATRILTENTMN
ncbi:hypothetical protein [Candidatus Reidiella endopervernicosa]|uniref:hypothetical protein n=1 Tax=Candidatus Reidiella endopervernicosa TaxID=2738883 RepID=UPI001F17D836|nr:hypothetical protein [Candidatus Reidiella endopervernicosa]